MRLCCIALAAVCFPLALPAQNKTGAAAQVERGKELFVNSTKGAPCGGCHQIGGVGTAVGPDLRVLASAVGPRAIAQSIEMSMTAYVQQVKTADSTFPGFVQKKSADEVDVWDLSKTPPELRKLAAKDVVSMDNNQTWKHPPAAAGYTSQELADVIAFLKYSATGTRKEIKASEVGESE